MFFFDGTDSFFNYLNPFFVCLCFAGRGLRSKRDKYLLPFFIENISVVMCERVLLLAFAEFYEYVVGDMYGVVEQHVLEHAASG
jgi:hypothetical protein